jgi:phage portal protein, lambda family
MNAREFGVLERLGHAIDSAIAVVAPQHAARRATARYVLTTIRGFEAASKGRRTSGWKTTSADANTLIGAALTTIRDRHRDLVRNNAWCHRAVQVIGSNAVGAGIIGRIVTNDEQRTKRLNELWAAWAESIACDAHGTNNFYGLQDLVMRTIVDAGEVITRRRFRRPEDGLPVPLQIQVQDPDHLDVSKTENLPNGGRIVHGVEFDAIGRRVAYWLFRDHPGDGTTLTRSLVPVRVPADEVLHTYRVDYVGQVRGIPWGTPIIIRARNLDSYEDAYLELQKVAACFAVFIEDADPLSPVQAAATLTEKIEPGRIEFLPTGKKVSFGNPPRADGYGPFTAAQLRAIAVTYGVSFEALTGDLSLVNFASGRMGWLEFQRNLDYWRWKMLIPRFCEPVGRWFLQAVSLLPDAPAVDDARFVWTPPRRELIDPVSEVPAMVRAVRGGLKSLQETHRELGYDSEDVLKELAQDFELLDKLGLVLDVDARKTSQAGLTQARPEGTVLPPTTPTTPVASDEDA